MEQMVVEAVLFALASLAVCLMLIRMLGEAREDMRRDLQNVHQSHLKIGRSQQLFNEQVERDLSRLEDRVEALEKQRNP